MEIGTITEEEGRQDNDSQTTETLEELFFEDPDHEMMRITEEPEVQNYWEAGLMTESLSTLKTGKVDHSQVICYHCSCKGHIKANCPDRKTSSRRPWDQKWKPRDRKTTVRRSHNPLKTSEPY